MRKRTILAMAFIAIMIASYVAAFTPCPTEDEFVDAITVMIDDFIGYVESQEASNPNYNPDLDPVALQNIWRINDLIEFYDSNELSTADCGAEGKYSGEVISEIVNPFVNVPLPESCADEIPNQDETGIDCGGVCPPCEGSSSCADDNDCATGYCNPLSKCSEPSCSDGWQNQGETGTDCGGPCAACGGDFSCTNSEDSCCLAVADSACDPDCEPDGWDPNCPAGAFVADGQTEPCDNGSPFFFGWQYSSSNTWTLPRPLHLEKVTFRMQDLDTSCNPNSVKVSFFYETGLESLQTPSHPRDRYWSSSSRICDWGPYDVEMDLIPVHPELRIERIKLDYIYYDQSQLQFDCIRYKIVEDKDGDLLDASKDCDDTNSKNNGTIGTDC